MSDEQSLPSQAFVPEDPSSPLMSWSMHSWDWHSLADENGQVSVIVASAPSQGGANALNIRSTDAVQAESELLSEFSQSKDYSFSIAFQGFSTRVDLSTLDRFLLMGDPTVWVYPDLPMEAMLSDTVRQIGAYQVWTMRDSTGKQVTGEGVVVAVIDAGIDYMHPDLGGGIGASYKVIGGYDFYNHDSNPMDDNGHGTHVAGIIAASGGTTGVAPGASLLAYKVLGSGGSGSMSYVISAIEAAMDPNGDGDTADHADVISMSLGGPGEEGDPVCIAVQSAIDAGVVVVVAAGNSGPSLGTVASPGLAPEAITVGAVDKSGVLADFSSRGVMPSLRIKPEISAPGVGVVSTVPFSNAQYSSPTGYASLSGTSMATPHISGAAALMLQMKPTWTPGQVKSALITGATPSNASLWTEGAGCVWLLDSLDPFVFLDEPMISYGFAGDPSQAFSIVNADGSITLSLSSNDWLSLSANGSKVQPYWTNTSSVSPTSIILYSGGRGTATLSIGTVGPTPPEGYYEGSVILTYSGKTLRLPFGYAVLSRLNVHVLDMAGREVFDPYGGVWTYRVPDASIAMGVRGDVKPSPPASFLLPSGQYYVHAAGHQLLYTYSNPYLLSAAVTLDRFQTMDLNLDMRNAKQLTLDLENDDGNPIYVKDYRMYCRYTGDRNVSFHLVGSDYSVVGRELFSLPKARTIYVTDMPVRVGVSIAGFSYSASMWDFFSRNWQHWYESPASASTEFLIESSADMQYLLAWEFNGIDSSTPTTLTLNSGEYSVYDTKYDIPGQIGNVWGNWGTHLSTGGSATFFTRRDTDTSLNPFFSGMTRKTIVQGVFSELYFPGNLFEGLYVRELYQPDYGHLVRADTISEIYVFDRNFLTPIEGVQKSERGGAGPFYPAVFTGNSNSTLALFHPLLRDQAGWAVGGMNVPVMNLYRGPSLVGIYQLSEYMARTNAKRVVSLPGAGAYSVQINYNPSPDICSNVNIRLGFTVPSSDVDPPRITGLTMPQRFVPGESINLQLTASDSSSISDVSVSWRSSGSTAWQGAVVSASGMGQYASTLQTSMSDAGIDLMVKITDSSGNYIEYTASNAAYAQVPVTFTLSVDTTEIGYRYADVAVVLTGRLAYANGAPISSSTCVPLELMVGSRKVGMVLDEYMASGTHAHNGSIRFEWHLNPMQIFSGPNQTVLVNVTFDLGVYEPVTRTISLRSTFFFNRPPSIALHSPANGSLIMAGTTIQLSISDDGAFDVVTYLDSVLQGPLASPWQISTSEWSDGHHTIEIVATDDALSTTHESFEFEVDALSPVVNILYPADGGRVPVDSILRADVYDSHLSQVSYSLDGSPTQSLAAPYSIDMTGWTTGTHTVTITASDMVGRLSLTSVTFEIASSTVVVEVVSPANGSVVRAGTPIAFSIAGSGTIAVRWSELGVWHDVSGTSSISTSGWSEGQHRILLNATNDLGGWDQLEFLLTIDSTPPAILLLSPLNQSFVDLDDVVSIHVSDSSFRDVQWYFWGQHRSSVMPDVMVYLTSPPADGYFSIRVTASDLAGNVAEATFVFAMDSSPPTITVRGFESGDAVAQGSVLEVDAQDCFLSAVRWSLDDGQLSSIVTPFDIETATFTSGWHELHIRASDFSGKQTDVTVRLYVDNSPPSVVFGSEFIFVVDESVEIEATVIDDFAVWNVYLYCQLPDGSYSALPMSLIGANYTVTIPVSLLWDGMNVFVRASDSAGNMGNSTMATLSAAERTPQGDIIPPGSGGDGGTEKDGSSGSQLSGIVGEAVSVMVIGAASAIVVLLLLMRDRQRSERHSGQPLPFVKPIGTVSAAQPNLSKPTVSEAKERRTGADEKPQPYGRTARTKSTPSVALIDAIPEVTIRSKCDPVDAADADIDYGELIERELILPFSKNSLTKPDLTASRQRTGFGRSRFLDQEDVHSRDTKKHFL